MKNLVLIAGGVGINPLVSVLSHLAHANAWPRRTHLLYATRRPAGGLRDILFYQRLLSFSDRFDMQLYLGRGSASDYEEEKDVHRRRMGLEDVRAIACDDSGMVWEGTVCYVCGPKEMTDEFVEGIKGFDGMDESDVLCEKWW